jgi:hypothetical protein
LSKGNIFSREKKGESAMSGKQFDQQQKAAIVENAKEIGFKEASRIAGVHYTTVYD